MAYIGNNPSVPGNFSSTTHSGTGSSLGPFAIGQSPGTKNAVLVFIDGVRQVPTIYGVSGSDVTFTAGNAPPLGTDNVQILVSGEELGVNVPADDSIAVAALDTTSAGATGQFLQKSGASTIDWATVASTPDLTTEGDLYKNYKEFTSDHTTPVDSDSNSFLLGPIGVSAVGSVTWTIEGDVDIL
tara:strand:- start:364 stop:918 length:555 start_codon:yes stop_codon:yes gene_type:complete